MEQKNQKAGPRKATAKDILLVVAVVALLLPVFWFKGAGEKWAAIILAAIPLVGLLYWLRLPKEKRIAAEQQAKAELDNSRLGRAWKYFMWALYALVGLAIVISLIAAIPAGAREPSPAFTVLDGRHAQELARQCSRDGPPGFQSTWQPSERDIKELEARLPLLEKLKASLCCIKGARVKDVHQYYRQYVGIVVNGRKLVYINALAISSELPFGNEWKSEPVMVCDGGTGFWGAIYDPQTKEFSQLAFNGVA